MFFLSLGQLLFEILNASEINHLYYLILHKTCSELKAAQALRTKTCAEVGMECCFGSGMTSEFWVNIVCFVFLFAARLEQTTETFPLGRCWWPAASLLRLDRAALSEALNNSQKLCLSLNTMFNTSHSKLKATKVIFTVIIIEEPPLRGCLGSYVPPTNSEHSRRCFRLPWSPRNLPWNSCHHFPHH